MHPRSPCRVSIRIGRSLTILVGFAGTTPMGLAAEPPRSDLRPAGEVAADERLSPLAGLSTAPVPPLLRGHIVLPEGVGLVVRTVAPGSRAERAGVRVHDVLVSLDGQGLLRPDHLAELVAAAGPEAPLALDVLRAGSHFTAPLAVPPAAVDDTLPPQPDAPAPLAEPPPGAAPIPTGQPVSEPLAATPAEPFVPPPGARRLGPDAVLLEGRDYWLKVYRAADLCLMARDARGWLVFNGPIATPEQRSLIPRQVRERVAKLEQMLDAVAVTPAPLPKPPAVATEPPKPRPAPAAPVTAAPASPAAAEPVTEIGRLDVDPIEIR
jgi:hypothetical protein